MAGKTLPKEDNRSYLKVYSDDRSLAAELNNMEKAGKPIHCISNDELEALLRHGANPIKMFNEKYRSFARLAGTMFKQIDAEFYTEALRKIGAKNIEICAVSAFADFPLYQIRFDGNFDAREFVKKVYN